MRTATKMTKRIEKEIEIPENADIKVNGLTITVKGPKGEVKRLFDRRDIKFESDGKSIIIKAEKNTKREKKVVGSINAHIKNMIKGALEGYTYHLKVCSGHFPVTVTVKGDELIIKNFLGEKVPRVVKIKKGAEVKVDGMMLTVKSPDKELAGQVSADIEAITRRTGFDTRIFQDGIYIINKSGKDIK